MKVQERNETNILNGLLRPVALAFAVGISSCSGNASHVAEHVKTHVASVPIAAKTATPAPKVVHIENKFDAKVWALNSPDIFVVWGVRKPHCVIDYVLKLDMAKNSYVNVSYNTKYVHEAMEAVRSEKSLEMVDQTQPSVNGMLCTYKRI